MCRLFLLSFWGWTHHNLLVVIRVYFLLLALNKLFVNFLSVYIHQVCCGICLLCWVCYCVLRLDHLLFSILISWLFHGRRNWGSYLRIGIIIFAELVQILGLNGSMNGPVLQYVLLLDVNPLFATILLHHIHLNCWCSSSSSSSSRCCSSLLFGVVVWCCALMAIRRRQTVGKNKKI